eukprot:4505079-Pyramimonas_sp.AAC.1
MRGPHLLEDDVLQRLHPDLAEARLGEKEGLVIGLAVLDQDLQQEPRDRPLQCRSLVGARLGLLVHNAVAQLEPHAAVGGEADMLGLQHLLVLLPQPP